MAGKLRYMHPDGMAEALDCHWSNRPTTEQVMEVWCLVCQAPPGQFCDRSRDWTPSTPDELAKAAAGTPPSHIERLWLRQGHDPAGLPPRRRGRRGKPDAPEVKQERTMKTAQSGVVTVHDDDTVRVHEFVYLPGHCLAHLHRAGIHSVECPDGTP